MKNPDGSPWGFDGHDDEADLAGWTGIKSNTYMELTETVMRGAHHDDEDDGMTLANAVMLCWAAAQPTSFEVLEDIRGELLSRLDDWSDRDKERIQIVELVKMYYGCADRNTNRAEHEDHVIPLGQLIRFSTDHHWNFRRVRSRHNFEDVLAQICEEHTPEDMSTFTQGRVLRSRVHESFQRHTRQVMTEQVVRKFREEMDAWGVTQQEGGNDESE